MSRHWKIRDKDLSEEHLLLCCETRSHLHSGIWGVSQNRNVNDTRKGKAWALHGQEAIFSVSHSHMVESYSICAPILYSRNSANITLETKLEIRPC